MRVLRLAASVYINNVYITNQFQTTFAPKTFVSQLLIRIRPLYVCGVDGEEVDVARREAEFVIGRVFLLAIHTHLF